MLTKTAILDRLSELMRRILPHLRSFFLGRWYPLLVGATVLLGHLFEIEYYLCIPNVLAVSLALILTGSARPFIPFALTFVYQVTRENSPGHPAFSDHYFTGGRLVGVLVLGAILAASVVYFIIKNRLLEGISPRTPLLVPLAVLSLGFILNGAFSSTWELRDLIFGITQSAIYALLFLFFYLSLRREEGGELLRYFIYSSAVTALVIVGELAGLYLGADSPVVDGVIVKEMISFGWGVMNTAGVCLAVLIPVCILGYVRSPHPIAYLAVALLTYLGVLLTLSRNAIIIGTIGLLASLVVACFCGEKPRRRLMRLLLGVGALLAAVLVLLLWDKLCQLFRDLVERGLSDNGRFELWRLGLENFLESPAFGSGFFSFNGTEWKTSDFLPDMPHQTLVTLLSGAGVFGAAAYLFYRVATLRLLLKRPTSERLLLCISVLVLLGESLLDNFVFYYLPVIYYTVTLAVAAVIGESTSAAKDVTPSPGEPRP